MSFGKKYYFVKSELHYKNEVKHSKVLDFQTIYNTIPKNILKTFYYINLFTYAFIYTGKNMYKNKQKI